MNKKDVDIIYTCQDVRCHLIGKWKGFSATSVHGSILSSISQEISQHCDGFSLDILQSFLRAFTKIEPCSDLGPIYIHIGQTADKGCLSMFISVYSTEIVNNKNSPSYRIIFVSTNSYCNITYSLKYKCYCICVSATSYQVIIYVSTASITNIIFNQRLSRLKLKTQISVLLLASEYIWLARDNKTGVTKIYPGVQRGIRFHSPLVQEVGELREDGGELS